MKQKRWRSPHVIDDDDDVHDPGGEGDGEGIDDLLDQFDSVDDSVDLDGVNIDGITDDDDVAD